MTIAVYGYSSNGSISVYGYAPLQTEEIINEVTGYSTAAHVKRIIPSKSINLRVSIMVNKISLKKIYHININVIRIVNKLDKVIRTIRIDKKLNINLDINRIYLFSSKIGYVFNKRSSQVIVFSEKVDRR